MCTREEFMQKCLSKYVYADMIQTDISGISDQFKHFRPSLDKYVFNDGSHTELMNLDGTIPVNYKGSTYNFPICIWIPEMYPYEPPIAYVKPTSTMQIRPGQNVDANGKISLPYLNDWEQPQSNLVDMLHILAIIFSEEPPVFTTSPNRQQYQNNGHRTGIQTCDLCERVGVNWKCVQCNEQYCDHCKLAHAKSRASNTHTINSTGWEEYGNKVYCLYCIIDC